MIFQVVILILWGSDSYFFVILRSVSYFSRVLILIFSGSDSYFLGSDSYFLG